MYVLSHGYYLLGNEEYPMNQEPVVFIQPDMWLRESMLPFRSAAVALRLGWESGSLLTSSQSQFLLPHVTSARALH